MGNVIMTQTADNLRVSIVNLIEAETRKIVEEEAKLASSRVESRVKSLAGQIATQVASRTQFSMVGEELLIKVQFPKSE